MLKRNPDERIDAAQALRHRWIVANAATNDRGGASGSGGSPQPSLLDISLSKATKDIGTTSFKDTACIIS